MQNLETCFIRSELNASRSLLRIERVPNVSLVAFELVTVPACQGLVSEQFNLRPLLKSSRIAAPFGRLAIHKGPRSANEVLDK